MSDHRFDLAGLRRSYAWVALDPSDLDPDPVVAFVAWLSDAVGAGCRDANTMFLATASSGSSASSAGVPSARAVLLKEVDGRGFGFYTNRTSRKGVELAANPNAAGVFRWAERERQVTLAGPVVLVDDAEADSYFASRPRANQIGAWASRQSQVVSSRSVIDEWVASATARFEGGDVPRPPFWGGYRIVPLTIEFWQGRPDRLHDRIRYRRSSPEEAWVVERLSP